MKRPNVLFLTPSLPHNTGTGSSIRAGATLEALAANFNVYVLHADFWGMLDPSPDNIDFVRQRSARFVRYVPRPSGECPVSQILSEYFDGIHFDAVHMFKLIMAKAAVTSLPRLKGSRSFAVLDLDDDECRSAIRRLQLREQTGDLRQIARERREISRLRMLEQLVLPHFQAVCLAGREDCEAIASRCRGPRPVYLPNVIFPLDRKLPGRTASRPTTLLFVGTLNYLPNEDGIIYFCSHILPLIKQNWPGPIRVCVVGARPEPKVARAIRLYPEVEMFANVPDLKPYYAEADVVIVPLRAGSGTRIKILEAFNFHRPVVSTLIGAEGLGVTNGNQLLIADEPKTFASACLRFMGDAKLSAEITESAYGWLQANHSLDNMQTAIDSLYQHVMIR